MATEYWYLQLPTGQALRGERPADTINRELQELVARGWEPVTMTATASLYAAIIFKKETPS